MQTHVVASAQGRRNPGLHPQTARPAPRRGSSPPVLQSSSAHGRALLEQSLRNPGQRVLASRPRWQQSFGPSALARHQLAVAIREDDWQAVESTRAEHPQFSFCSAALLTVAAQAGAIKVATWLQCQGADPFAPDAAASAFYAALRRGDDRLASQMLAFRQLMDPASFPNGMDAPPVTASDVPKWKCQPTT